MIVMDNNVINLALNDNKEYIITALDQDNFKIKLEQKNYKINLIENPDIRIVKLTEKGDPGPSAYEVATNNGFTGTPQQWLDSLKEVSNSRYDFSVFFQGSIYASEELYNFVCVTPFKLLVNLNGSKAKVKTKPSSTFAFLLLKNNVQFGTLIFNSNSYYGYFSSVETTFYPEDVFQIVADNVIDPNLTNVAISIAAYRQIFGG